MRWDNSYYFCVIFYICLVPLITISKEVGHGITTDQEMTLECETPNQERGVCIEIEKCRVLFRQLNNSAASKFLNESKCDPWHRNVSNKVCCGKYDNYKNISTNTVKETRIFPKSCGRQVPVTTSRIVGGNESAPGEFPWMARLLYKVDGRIEAGCGGFLINYRHVMTAAHCIVNEDKTLYSVVLGEHNTGTNESCIRNGTECIKSRHIRKVVKVTVHPGFNPFRRINDIAIIQLKSGIRRSKYVQPICLPRSHTQIPDRYYITGWGKTDKVLISEKKMKVDVLPYEREKCKQKYSVANVTILDTQICAGGEKGKDACVGDSGGPLMMSNGSETWYASGIVSYGMGCGMEGWPGVYTNIVEFLPWIRTEIAKNILSMTKKDGAKSGKRKIKIK